MFKTYIVPFFAVLGVIFAVRTVVVGSRPTPVAPALIEPTRAPYTHFVAGAGILEASSENISIAAAVPGLVTEIPVKVGQDVKRGDILFVVDPREQQAELAVRKAELATSVVELENARSLLSMRQSVATKGAVSIEDLTLKRSALERAETAILQAKARVAQAETEIERRHVRAPLDAQVLQLRLRVGEYAPAQVVSQPLLVLGVSKPLHVRVDVDENDGWRLRPGAPAIAMLRGNREVQSTLEFVRYEPLVVPKRSLSGDTFERVDTRVLQAVYRVSDSAFPAYVGQLVDVYIEAKE